MFFKFKFLARASSPHPRNQFFCSLGEREILRPGESFINTALSFTLLCNLTSLSHKHCISSRRVSETLVTNPGLDFHAVCVVLHIQFYTDTFLQSLVLPSSTPSTPYSLATVSRHSMIRFPTRPTTANTSHDVFDFERGTRCVVCALPHVHYSAA
jgi:hypothetical protein